MNVNDYLDSLKVGDKVYSYEQGEWVTIESFNRAIRILRVYPYESPTTLTFTVDAVSTSRDYDPAREIAYLQRKISYHRHQAVLLEERLKKIPS